MQKIIVTDVSSKPTKNGGTIYTVTDEKGSKFSGFHESLGSIQKGSTIEADIEVSGKFNNIKEWKLLTPATEMPPANQTQRLNGNHRSPEDRISIERQVCLKCACEIHGGADSIDVILENASKMYRWLSGESLKSAAKADPESEVKKAEGDLPDFKNGAELFNYALKHGYTLDKIKGYLGVNNPNEIKDLNVAIGVLFGNANRSSSR